MPLGIWLLYRPYLYLTVLVRSVLLRWNWSLQAIVQSCVTLARVIIFTTFCAINKFSSPIWILDAR